MSEDAIRASLFTILKAIAGIGKCYDYTRWNNDWGKFIELFKDSTGKILGWELGRAAVQSTYLSNADGEETHAFIIRGYMAVNDAQTSEKVFNAKIETIRATFRRNYTLNDTVHMVSPVSAQVIDQRVFGSVLCHYAELRIDVTEFV